VLFGIGTNGRFSFSEELAGLHKTMAKLLKQKDALQLELGNKYGTSAVPFPYDYLAEILQVSLH